VTVEKVIGEDRKRGKEQTRRHSRFQMCGLKEEKNQTNQKGKQESILIRDKPSKVWAKLPDFKSQRRKCECFVAAKEKNRERNV
jgi:hypothetical protein